MPAVNPGVYKAVLRVRKAYVFDIGGLLMRLYSYMMHIGTITMLTLSGYSFLLAGIMASIIAIAMFFIAPRISKLVDEHGQSRVVPIAAIITLCGLAGMLITVALHGPIPIMVISALLMGFVPNAQALVRARWTYLIRTGILGDKAPTLRTMFSYEGVIDDIGFMFGSSVSVAISAALFPTAGLLSGGIVFAVGATMLVLSRSTEPSVGWDSECEDEQIAQEEGGKPGKAEWRDDQAEEETSTRSIFLLSPVVRVLFVLMLFLGALYGVFDTATVSLAEDVENPGFASIVLILSACASMLAGIIFGMIKLRAPQHLQLIGCAILIGCAYGTMILINSISSLTVVAIVAAMFYSPFLIVINGTCECSVPGDRLTEAITWVNIGFSLGMAFAPTIAGLIIDEAGTLSSFILGTVFALAIPVTALLCFRLLKRHVHPRVSQKSL